MKTIIIFLMVLLQNIAAQQDSLQQDLLNRSASGINNPSENIQSFFSRFFTGLPGESPAAIQLDTVGISYFDIVFNEKPEYNLEAKLINVNFNYLIADQYCNNVNRNGILLLEKIERTAATKKGSEKLNKTVYVLIPDKCSSTRFYNSKGDMFCDNKRQFIMEYEEGKIIAENLKVRVGIQLLSESEGNFYDKLFPAEENYPVETHVKEYVLRCCIRSIIFLNDDKIIDNFVSLK